MNFMGKIDYNFNYAQSCVGLCFFIYKSLIFSNYAVTPDQIEPVAVINKDNCEVFPFPQEALILKNVPRFIWANFTLRSKKTPNPKMNFKLN